jgi:hypothetical protein
MAASHWKCGSVLSVVVAAWAGAGCGEDGSAAQRGETTLEEGAPARDLRIAPEPERMSGARVRTAPQAPRASEPLGASDFERILDSFPAVRTPLAHQWLTAQAWTIAARQPGLEARRLLQQVAPHLTLVRDAHDPTTGVPSEAECHVGFDDRAALDSLPNQARTTSAHAPFYSQPCGDGALHVEPLNYGQYHLAYEDFPAGCVLDASPSDGEAWEDCAPLDGPGAAPRLLGAHLGDQVIRIWYGAGPDRDAPRSFSLQSFVNVGGEPVQVRYRTGDGAWFQWRSLDGQTMWFLSPHADEVTEVRITHADTSLECGADWDPASPEGCPIARVPFFLDDFAIDP